MQARVPELSRTRFRGWGIETARAHARRNRIVRCQSSFAKSHTTSSIQPPLLHHVNRHLGSGCQHPLAPRYLLAPCYLPPSLPWSVAVGSRLAAALKGKGRGGAAKGQPAKGKGRGGTANMQCHRHREAYFYPHEDLATHQIVATDMWISGEPRAKSLAACWRVVVD